MERLTLGQAEFADVSAEILARGSALRFTAHGASMTPFIRDGDLLTLEPVEVAALETGDVILCRTTGNGLVAHRLIGRETCTGETLLVVRGDASCGPGERARPEHVLGRVVSIQRGSRTIYPDRGWQRLAALAWLRLSPLRPLLFRLAHAAGTCLLFIRERSRLRQRR
ncbi:MAG: S24/S26 family peptidase [Thermoflexales bacterium]|nr:S24/S26 family peptidase [Thermoflexales bacterium]